MKHYPPVGEVAGKKHAIAEMFDAIAPRYDLLNRVLSAGIDRRWRRKAVDWIAPYRPRRILDIATGTGDLALEAARLAPDKIVGVDIAEEMLRIGRRKVAAAGLEERIVLQRGDAERLPFSDAQFDAALVAFGVRNFENLQRGLEQIRRVLRPGGVLVVLEFSRPTAFPVRSLYALYGRYLLPLIGRIISKDEGAYTYLPESIAAFPDGTDFLEEMRRAGFGALEVQRLTFGIASLYRGEVERPAR